MRGSGDSEGFYYDEYEKQEQDDCCDVISWISQQYWCTGNVGKLCAKSVKRVIVERFRLSVVKPEPKLSF